MSTHAAWLLILGLLSHNHCEFMKKLSSWFQTTNTRDYYKHKRRIHGSLRQRCIRDLAYWWDSDGGNHLNSFLVCFIFFQVWKLFWSSQKVKERMLISLKEVGLACLVTQISSTNLSFPLTLRKELWLVCFDQGLLFNPVSRETYMHKIMKVKADGRDCHYTWEHRVQDSVPSDGIYHRPTVIV